MFVIVIALKVIIIVFDWERSCGGVVRRNGVVDEGDVGGEAGVGKPLRRLFCGGGGGGGRGRCGEYGE